VDDRLDTPARRALDEAAQRDLAGWRARCDEALTADGACLPWIHEVELLVDVFHRERRALTGFAHALATGRPAHVEVQGADPDLAQALEAIAAGQGIEIRIGEPGPPPRFPIGIPVPARGRLTALREQLGAPALLRGDVLLQPPDRHLAGVRTALARRGHRPVEDVLRGPQPSPRALLGHVAHGGWMAHPGRRERSRARAAHSALLAALPPTLPEAAPVEALQHARARAMLGTCAADTLADVAAARRSVARGRLRAFVTGSGAQGAARILAIAGRESGVPLIEVLHGFSLGLWSVDGRPASTCDGLVGDRVAAWSAHDVAVLSPHAFGTVVRTGNPAAAEGLRRLGAARGRGSSDYALVLVQAPGWATAVLGTRAPLHHAGAALEGLAAARPELPVVLRPHPLDRTSFESIAGGNVRVARGGPLEPLLAGAALVVGSLSTATLESAAAGLPTVLLEPSGAPVEWPFDGSSAIGVARDPGDLAAALRTLGQSADPAAVADAREALGADPNAVDAVVELILGP
jgi:hypothetical protein